MSEVSLSETNEPKKKRQRRVNFTARQARFIDNILSGMYAYEAYMKAGYKVKNERIASSCASDLMAVPRIREEIKRRQEERRERLLRKMEGYGEEAAEKVREIMREGDSSAVQLAAARDILDRIGVKPIDVHYVDGEPRVVIVARRLNREGSGDEGTEEGEARSGGGT